MPPHPDDAPPEPILWKGRLYEAAVTAQIGVGLAAGAAMTIWNLHLTGGGGIMLILSFMLTGVAAMALAFMPAVWWFLAARLCARWLYRPGISMAAGGFIGMVVNIPSAAAAVLCLKPIYFDSARLDLRQQGLVVSLAVGAIAGAKLAHSLRDLTANASLDSQTPPAMSRGREVQP